MSRAILTGRVAEVTQRLRCRYADNDHGNLRADPLGELLYILCSVRTHARGYQASFRALLLAYPTPDLLASAKAEDLAVPLRGGGMAAVRAKAVRGVLDGILAHFGRLTLDPLREWDDAACEAFLTGLPYVGKKVARCVMMYSLGREVFPVDLHCWRICRRLGWVRPTRPDGTCSQHDMERTQEKIPPEHRFSLHVNMVSHGRACCTSKAPACLACPVQELCPKIGVQGPRG